jgi:hypothetical protein
VAKPKWTIRLPDRSSGSTSPRFSRQRRSKVAWSSPIMIRAFEPPMKQLRFSSEFVHIGCFIARSKSPKWLSLLVTHYGSCDPKRISRYQ